MESELGKSNSAVCDSAHGVCSSWYFFCYELIAFVIFWLIKQNIQVKIGGNWQCATLPKKNIAPTAARRGSLSGPSLWPFCSPLRLLSAAVSLSIVCELRHTRQHLSWEELKWHFAQVWSRIRFFFIIIPFDKKVSKHLMCLLGQKFGNNHIEELPG